MTNARYEELNRILKLNKKNKTIDKNLLKGLFSQILIEHKDSSALKDDLKKGTIFSDLSKERLVSLFSEEKFNKLTNEEHQALLQEVHNRYMKKRGYDVTRNVAVYSKLSSPRYGSANLAHDELFINKKAINKAIKTPGFMNLNKHNIGIFCLDTMLKESQRIAQMESTVDLCLGKKLDPDTAFVAALNGIELANQEEEHFCLEDRKTIPHYERLFLVHNANYTAFRKLRDTIPAKDRQGKQFDQFDLWSTRISLQDFHGLLDPKTEDWNYIEDKIQRMERFTRREIKYFKNTCEDCEMKKRLLDACEDYMKVDKEGNSPFRERLRRELGQMVKISKKAKANLGQKRGRYILSNGIIDRNQEIDLY